MSLPFFPMYPTDFEADTSHLTMTEDGAYNRLLRLCWMTPGCSLPADDAWVLRRMRVRTDDEREAVLSVLSEFFTVTDGRYSNARLTRICHEANEAHGKRKKAGEKGGKAKAQKTNKTAPSNAQAMPKQPEPEPEPEPIREDPPFPPSGGDGFGFEDFWEIVPKQIAKGAAERAYSRALKITDAATIFAAMRAYAESRAGQDDQYTAHPSAWLKARRWEDTPKPQDSDEATDEFQSAIKEIERLERERIERGREVRGGLRIVAGMDGGGAGA